MNTTLPLRAVNSAPAPTRIWLQRGAPLVLRSAMRLLLIAVLLVPFVAASSARAQWEVGGNLLPPVMSSRDYDALVAALELDATQRQLVGALFDDAQARMFEACAADPIPLAARGPNDETPTQRALADQEQRRRTQMARVMASFEEFFTALTPLVRPDQAPTLERERLACERHLLRVIMRAEGQSPLAKHDLERAVARGKYSPEEMASAYAALHSYRLRLSELLRRLADETLGLPGKIAAKQRTTAPTPPVLAGTGMVVNSIAHAAARASVSRAYQELLDQLSQAHRDGMAALEQALGAVESDVAREAAYSRLWPRCNRDGSSPREVFQQLSQRHLDDMTMQAVALARAQWLRRWWPIALAMSREDDALRRLGGAMVGPESGGAEVRAKLNELRNERAAVNAHAWRALAAADPAHKALYLSNAEFADSRESGEAQPLPAPEPGVASATGESGAPIAVEVESSTIDTEPNAMMTASVSISSADGEVQTFVIHGDEVEGGGAIGVTISGDGIPIVLGDAFRDGLGGPFQLDFVSSSADTTEPNGPELAGGQLPRPISKDEATAIAHALGLAPDDPVFGQLFEDYLVGARAIDQAEGAEVRATLAGSAVKFAYSQGQPDETPVERLRGGLGKLDAALAALAAADDAFIASAGATGGATEAAIARTQLERARMRLLQFTYPAPPSWRQSPCPARAVAMLKVVREADLSSADQAVALAALDQWAPGVYAALDAERSMLRGICVEVIEQARAENKRANAFLSARRATAASGETATTESLVGTADAQEKAAQARKSLEEARARTALQCIAGRDALLAALSREGQSQFLGAWRRAAAPQAYQDRKDALPKVDAALQKPALGAALRARLEALRAQHSLQHDALCARLADLQLERTCGAGSGGDFFRGFSDVLSNPTETAFGALRFERAELDARTGRRLAALTDQILPAPASTP